jgi:hypothetical protein
MSTSADILKTLSISSQGVMHVHRHFQQFSQLYCDYMDQTCYWLVMKRQFKQ